MRRTMRTRLPWSAFAATAAAVATAGPARAQTTSGSVASSGTTTTGTTATPCAETAGGTPTISVTQQIVPERFINGVDVGTSTRPVNLNPNGVNYQDCIQDMTLEFKLTACNFDGQNIAVWASSSSQCTDPTDRGIGQASVCWNLGTGSAGFVQAEGEVDYFVRVQDIVGPQSQNPPPTSYSKQGSAACTAQSTFVAVPININFIPTDSAGNLVGQAFSYALTTDLVGPPAPLQPSIGPGDTLFVVNWTPNTDTDTAGYDLLIDPIPGMEPADAGITTGGMPTATTVLVCPDSGMSSDLGADASDDAGDATVASVPDATVSEDDAGCHTVTMANGTSNASNGNGGVCNDPVLMGGTVVDGGTGGTTLDFFDDAGNLLDASLESTTGGGIFVPPAGHVVNPNAATGSTVSGATSSTYTISGLKNNVTYTVAVSAVDNSGNVGPPSEEQCNYPAPVNDFFKDYRNAGGTAGGGFCALEAVGAPASSTMAFAGLGALVVAQLRRRRARRSRSS